MKKLNLTMPAIGLKYFLEKSYATSNIIEHTCRTPLF
jgi:hypothetical protein